MGIRDTPATYCIEEAARIREMVTQELTPLACPRCDQPLLVGQPFVAGDARVREVCCSGCHRCVMVREPLNDSAASPS